MSMGCPIGKPICNFHLTHRLSERFHQAHVSSRDGQEKHDAGFHTILLAKNVNRIAMKQLEERLNNATHWSFNDLTKKDTMWKFSPIVFCHCHFQHTCIGMGTFLPNLTPHHRLKRTTASHI